MTNVKVRRIFAVVFAFPMLVASFWPHMIPYTVTVWDAAAPPESLELLFRGGDLVVFPVVLIYAVRFLDLSRQAGKVAHSIRLMAALTITSLA
jgi:cytochrome bd ubiquinol oxidase subunit II